MSFIPTCYYTKPILNLVDSLIDDGYESYSNLSDADKDRITSLCIDALGEDAYSCLIEVNLDRTLSKFKKFIFSRTSDCAYDLADIMNVNAREYFEDTMNDLFSERSSKAQDSKFIDTGFLKYIDSVTGEVEWRKSR